MWSERTERLSEVIGSREREVDLPLLKGVRLPRDLFARVRTLAQRYRASCELFGPRLNNLTPNGLLLPKLETTDDFNRLHKAFAECVRWAEVQAAKAHLPINLRISSGEADLGRDSRPRSSTKLHSDIWAGEPSCGVLLFLFLENEHASQVRFFEPEDFPPEFQQPLDDYLEGMFGREAWVTTPYQVDLEPGILYAADSLLLHRTERLGADTRTSIDVRVLPHRILSSDLYDGAGRLENYVPFSSWFGAEIISGGSMYDPPPPDQVKNAYAQHYQMGLL